MQAEAGWRVSLPGHDGQQVGRGGGSDFLVPGDAPPPPGVLESANPAWARCVILMRLVNGMGNSLSPGQPTPGGVKQDKSSGGSVGTTKTRSDPQGFKMSRGERPIGAAKGTVTLCHPPAPPESPPGHDSATSLGPLGHLFAGHTAPREHLWLHWRLQGK